MLDRLPAVLLLLLVSTSSGAAAQGSCSFQLGFAGLAALIPGVVGNCLTSETHNPLNGDAVQRTSAGLLVWRKADNFTAFTDGGLSWVNGPLGLQQRSNDERLWWEANPEGLPVVPVPAPGERCHTANLALSLDGVDVGAGNLVGTFRLTNTSSVGCTFFGYPGAQLLDATYDGQPTLVVRGGGYFSNKPPPRAVTVAPRASASVRVHWEQIPVGDETTCSMASYLAMTPPDEFVPLILPAQIRACGGGHLDLTPVLPSVSLALALRQ